MRKFLSKTPTGWRALLVFTSLFMISLAGIGQVKVYQCVLTGAAEAPPNSSTGIGTVTVTIDQTALTMRVQCSFSGLLGNVTAAHIHASTAVASTGTAGVATTTPTFPGFPSAVNSGTYDRVLDLSVTSSYNSAFITANGGTVSNAYNTLITALNNSKAYFNIHSTMYPGGEIRGFLRVVPTISSFSPTTATSGGTVTITGSEFTGATAVSFGGTPANSFSVVDDYTITAVVGAGTSGDIAVTTPGGIATISGFTYCVPPSITSATAARDTVCTGTTTTLTANGVSGTGAMVMWYTGPGGTGTAVGTGTTVNAGPGTYYARVLGNCGTAEASVTVASYSKRSQQWTWVTGSNTTEPAAVYGTKGVASSTNTPGARDFAVRWRDNSGNIWLFGGYGRTETTLGRLNDLWKFDVTTKQWTWVSGDNSIDNPGVYGTKGVAHSNNKPGGRTQSVSWTDASGNLWLFGGFGYNLVGAGRLNDLWKYNIASNQWTWVNGENTFANNSFPVFGTQGVAAAANTPGGRQTGAGMTDASGNLWLFGGYGNGENSQGSLNDLWKLDVATGQWAWMGGDKTANNVGVYGTKGTGSTSNKPGARNDHTGWADASGSLWIYGGFGYHETNVGFLSDLWKYTPATGEWTWVSGDKTGSGTATYGTKGTASVNNKPGGRFGHASSTDGSGNLLLFGGQGGAGYVNDLWKYNTSTNEWTWVAGDNTPDATGVYGIQGSPAVINKPGARLNALMWGSGNDVWLFGGNRSNSGPEKMNDLWQLASVVEPPLISSFTPATAPAGSTVTLTGTGFTCATAVAFGGTAAASFTVVDDNTIAAVVGSGASGNVTVTTPDGTATLAGFVFCEPVSLDTVTAATDTICPAATTTLTAQGVSGTNALITWRDQRNGGGNVLGTGTTLSNAGPGTYYVIVLGSCGNPVEDSITVSSKALVAITDITAAETALCTGSFTTLTADGVAGTNATVTWYDQPNGGGNNLGTGTTLPNVGPGTYYARVTGDCGDPMEESVTISAKVDVFISSVAATETALCTGTTTTLTANGVAGTNATVTWYDQPNGGGNNLGTGTTLPNVGPGTYYARVTGDCGGPMEESLTIQTLSTSSSDTTATVCGGFNWRGTIYTTSGDKTFTTTNAAGCDSVITLHLTITPAPTWYADVDADGYGNPAVSQQNCSQPTGYVANATDCDDNDNTVYPGAPEKCDGKDNDCDGTADEGAGPSISSITAPILQICRNTTTLLTANGVDFNTAGSAAVTPVINWYTGAGGTGTFRGTGSTLSVFPGTYYARIVTTCGVAEKSVTIQGLPRPQVTATATNLTCADVASGTITSRVTGGVAPFTFSLGKTGTYSSSPNFTGLPAGNYRVNVKDSNGCTDITGLVVITSPAKLTATAVVTAALCGSNTGSVTLNASGGTPPYQYKRAKDITYKTSNVFNNLFARIYYLMVKDANGCTVTRKVTVPETGCTTSFARTTLPGSSIETEELQLTLSPNPSPAAFMLRVNSPGTAPVKVRVMDVNGRILYTASGSGASQLFHFGERFTSGVYLVEVRQGEDLKTLKAVKMK